MYSDLKELGMFLGIFTFHLSLVWLGYLNYYLIFDDPNLHMRIISLIITLFLVLIFF